MQDWIDKSDQAVASVERFPSCYASLGSLGVSQVPIDSEVTSSTRQLVRERYSTCRLARDLGLINVGWTALLQLSACEGSERGRA